MVMVAASAHASERRSHRRVPLHSPVRLDDRAGQAVDVSLGGMGIECSVPPEPGSSVRVLAQVAGGAELAVAAEVVRVDGTRVGVRFMALSPAALSALLAHTSQA